MSPESFSSEPREIPKNVEKIILPDGISSLASDLESSNGASSVVVHPFFFEKDGGLYKFANEETLKFYHRYLVNLNKSVTKYRENGIPTILFETAENMNEIDQILSRLNINDGKIYLVSTLEESPDLDSENFNLEDLSKLLKENGLNRAVVSGSYFSYFYYSDRFPKPDFKGNEPIGLADKYALKGCVGRVVNDFLSEGIVATTAFATYSRYNMRNHSELVKKFKS